MAIELTGEMQVIDTALADRVPCLVGTADAAGQPQISPKGSVMVLDQTRLAYWERAGRSSIANIADNPKIVVYYRNPQIGKVWRFYGTARPVTSGTLLDEVWRRTIPAEQEKDPDRKGCAVVMDVELVNDLSGKVIQQA